jgi:hypothetical protein
MWRHVGNVPSPGTWETCRHNWLVCGGIPMPVLTIASRQESERFTLEQAIVYFTLILDYELFFT